MQITLERKPLDQVDAGALIVPVFEDAKEHRFGAPDLLEAGEFVGKSHDLLLLHNVPGIAAKRVLWRGRGSPPSFARPSAANWRARRSGSSKRAR